MPRLPKAELRTRPIAQRVVFDIRIVASQGRDGDLDEYALRHHALKELLRAVGQLSDCDDARLDEIIFLESVDVKEKV